MTENEAEPNQDYDLDTPVNSTSGLRQGLTSYGDAHFSLFLRKVFIKALGYSEDSLSRPIIGIINTFSGFNPCHANVPQLIEAAKRGVQLNGGLAIEFPTISVAESFSHPTSMFLRNLMSMDTEEMIKAQPLDACIMIGGCDKTVPAQLMGGISANKPILPLITGPMLPGSHRGKRIGACTDCRNNWAAFRAGEIDVEEISAINEELAPTIGTCGVMGTASTMACITAALGMMPLRGASAPAVSSARLRIAEETGANAVAVAKAARKPQEILSKESFLNAITVLQAIGGSTNAVVHLLAIANRHPDLQGVITLQTFEEIGKKTPLLVDLKPSGDNYMNDFHNAGGMLALLQVLRPLLHLSAKTISGQTLGEVLDASKSKLSFAQDIIRPLSNPLHSSSSLAILHGNLAPNGAVLKASASKDRSLLSHTGPAVVFENSADLALRIDDPDLPVTRDSVLVLKGIGPIGNPGMPEAGLIPIPKKLAAAGVKDMLRLSDGRMSGTAGGTIILHISPESAVPNSPFGVVETGDLIICDIETRRLHLDISDDVLQARISQRKQTLEGESGPVQARKQRRGYRGLYERPPGPTVLAYTPDGRRVITGGSNQAIRIYTVGEDGEPKTVDGAIDGHCAIGATNKCFLMGAEDGTVWQYDAVTGQQGLLLLRCALPIRDIAVSRDGEWAAVASDELTVKIVKIEDMTQTKYLREQEKGAKHVAFDPNGRYVAVSDINGKLYIYSLNEEEPELVRKLDGVIQALEPEKEATSKAVWHPDGTAFAVAEATRDISIYSISEWKKEKTFTGGHTGDITALSWSPNGTLLASAGADGRIVLWETKTQKILQHFDFANVINIAWHPTKNSLSFTNSDGELFIYDNFVPKDQEAQLAKPLQAAPIFAGPLTEISNNARQTLADRSRDAVKRAARAGTPDSLDDILGEDEEMADFVDDDDGAGYAEELNAFGKRPNGHLDAIDGPESKRVFPGSVQVKAHPPLQPGSTPWAGNRRYLCLNLTGAVWTVDQETHHTVTVEFYDREAHRDFHFTDPYQYDKACLNENGTLFSNNPEDGPASIFYRPHETWTTRADWRTTLPEGETVRALALSESYIVAITSKDYVRVYTLFGTPFRVYRQKSQAVTCSAWRDYIMTIGNGPVSADGRQTTLHYTVENVKRDEICQNEDVVALSSGAQLQSVFFSDMGDPCIYDTTGTLLVLQHWRTTGQARWVPLLDTKQLARLAGGRKEETYWPVAVAQDKFHCIILKGGDKNPYFPRPLLSEFDFQLPISSKPVNDSNDEDAAAGNEVSRFEETFVRGSVLLSLFRDLLSSTNATSSQRTELARKELDIDKTLLQMLAIECREGEDRGMKALELVNLMTDRNGKMIEAAAKVAQRYGRGVLEDKIRDLAERRVMGMGDDDELA
ncbi:glycosyl hydrolase family 62-domain-containing protein [Penicillium atrosanguineum]|uniref:glycosyl hydrolase family 62-domain-containing protein n=1 Tax=Penicillium atrosanguineum TaxID=1132637 RepID=UPI00239E9555|nr:glycosyl hydrolase family 62-domain-containing protein [Penicillium atrosanguineum]KAJ5293270.1 glycosyl hydrolase family 62-domain-containing protein [Penicillium atrosanguineum]